MGIFRLLISPRFVGFKNSFKRSRGSRNIKAITLAGTGILFWLVLFFLFYRVLTYFSSQEMIGDILARHLLAMVLLVFFSILIFSNIITALSNLYISQDLELCHSSPATLTEVFLSRSFYTVIDSSWMLLVFGIPVMMAYGFVYRGGLDYYLSLIYVSVPLIIIAASLGIMVIMVLVRVFPAQRASDIIMFLSIVLVIVLYFLFRFLRPERLVNPDTFMNIAQYLTALKVPDSPYLPSHWATDLLWGQLIEDSTARLFNHLLLWSTAFAMVVIDIWISGIIYFNGFSKAQEAKRRSRTGRRILDSLVSIVTRPFGPDTNSLISKDIRTFFRDNSQWSQLLLLGALVVVYLYNFSVLPLERSPIKSIYLQNALSFLNIGLAGFVISALSARFIFPAVSSEGQAFWIIRSSPLSLRRFLWSKYFAYLIPMLFLAELLIIYTNYLLKVTTFMMVLSSITIFFMVFGIVALGVGLGAVYPNFKHENIAKVATSFGGLVYMISSAIFIALVIILEAGPVYSILSAHFRGRSITDLQWIWVVSSFTLVMFINIIAVQRPMAIGLKTLSNFEG
jgi:ABC-2 type transport system permease protein